MQLTFPTAQDRDEAALQIRRLKDRIRQRRPLGRDLENWIRWLAPKQQKYLADHGLVPDELRQQQKTLALIADYITHLRSQGDAPHHVQTTESCAKIAMAGCVYPHQITRVKVEANLQRLPGKLAARTKNGYLESAKAFTNWLEATGVLETSPLRHMKKLNEDAGRTYERRPMQPGDLLRLLEAAIDGEPWGRRMKVCGMDRYWLYRIAAETGLRANELRSLVRGSFDLEVATVRVAAANVKNRRPVVLPLRRDTAAELRDYLGSKMPDAPAFRAPQRTAVMLQADLAVAGIPVADGLGRKLDFHSLRGAMAVALRHADVDPGVRQAFMRHSDPRLTLVTYDTPEDGLRAAAESLPSLTPDAVRGRKEDVG